MASKLAALPWAAKVAPVIAPLAYLVDQWRRDKKTQGVVTRGDAGKEVVHRTKFIEFAESSIYWLVPLLASAVATGVSVA